MTSAEEKSDAFVWRADVQTEALCAHMSAIFILELSLSADLYFDPLRLFIHKYSVGCWLLLSFVLTWSLLCGWLDKHTSQAVWISFYKHASQSVSQTNLNRFLHYWVVNCSLVARVCKIRSQSLTMGPRLIRNVFLSCVDPPAVKAFSHFWETFFWGCFQPGTFCQMSS